MFYSKPDLDPKDELVQRPCDKVETKVSRYDQVSSGLSAGVALLGVMAGTLVLIWVCSLSHERFVVIPNTIPPGEISQVKGIAEDIEPPGDEEHLDIMEPSIADALEELDVFSTVQSNPNTMSGNDPTTSNGSGFGDRRIPGDGDDFIPPIENYKKWQIEYETSSFQAYAKQIDALEIQLGAPVKEGDSIFYLTGASTNTPLVKKGKKSNDDRIYFTQKSWRLRDWDSRLLTNAGIKDMKNRIPVQFFPAELINKMTNDESMFLREHGKKSNQVKMTIFEIVKSPDGFEVQLKNVVFLK